MAIVYAFDGEASFEAFDDLYIGSTGTGDFPPVGRNYAWFQFRPSIGKNGILLFLKDDGRFRFVSYSFDRFMKLTVEIGKATLLHQVGQADSFGMFTVAQGRTFVNQRPSYQDREYRVVDPISLLQYAEGRITIEELDERAEIHEAKIAEEAEVVRLRDENTVLNTELRLQRMRLTEAEQRYVKLSFKHNDTKAQLDKKIESDSSVLKALQLFLGLRRSYLLLDMRKEFKKIQKQILNQGK